jgi:hypothetical protein
MAGLRTGSRVESLSTPFDCLVDHADQIYRFQCELDMVALDACDVEQVVHEPDQSLNLALDDVELLGAALFRIAPSPLHRNPDRGQRVPQLTRVNVPCCCVRVWSSLIWAFYCVFALYLYHWPLERLKVDRISQSRSQIR